MADQRRNAGNIGDVFKHSLLPVLVAGFDASQSGDWVYCETHAGYCSRLAGVQHAGRLGVGQLFKVTLKRLKVIIVRLSLAHRAS